MTADGAEEKKAGGRAMPAMLLTALGIVYGDIGTSPIYALRECFRGGERLAITPENVYGILSLIFWALIVVISLKYLTFMLRADNKGEGGIIALVALIRPATAAGSRVRSTLVLLGLGGVALLYGDGTITPAISVLSAIEGLEIATPVFTPYIIPITIGILIALFVVQSRGTARIGRIFGPVMLAWFAVIGVLGIGGILNHPAVLTALNPLHGIVFLATGGLTGFLVLGAVFLVVTGGEALYADMGHVGKRPIRIAWFGLVLPALVLSYFGQGAAMLAAPETAGHPFYLLAPDWALYPLVALATAATVIASQAIITGVFSLTGQAIQLGFLPRMIVHHTRSEEQGQIYVPTVNWLLMTATVLLVLGFRSSGNLASAYGIAVSLDMVITSILAGYIMRKARWPLWMLLPGLIAFLVVDLAFFGANLAKIADGGWYPLAVGALMFTVLTSWRRGRELVLDGLAELRLPTERLFARLRDAPVARVPGTAVFIVEAGEGTPATLVHQLDHIKALHEHIVLLDIEVRDEPRVPTAERLVIEKLEQGFCRVTVSHGFMQSPNVPVALRLAEREGLGFDLDLEQVTYFIGRSTAVPEDSIKGMALWREKLFAFLSRNAPRPTAFYRIPPDRVVELGLQVEI